jgi:hypothetical protein
MNGEPSLFDSLARLVPEELQAAYYRVLAHTQTLSADDEMLRILEAMGILALVTRHTPAEIACERERFRELLETQLQAATETQREIVTFGEAIDRRLINLPKEIEAGLNPKEISSLLGETLRQQFATTGIQETVSILSQSVSKMRDSQQKLAAALAEVADPRFGVVAKMDSANRAFDQSVELRTERLDEFLQEIRTDFLKIWMPIILCGALLIGFDAGRAVQVWRDASKITTQVKTGK